MSDFEHDANFEMTEAAGNLDLDRYEQAYRQVFDEVLEDGVITAEERERLDRAADSLGLAPARISALEQALQQAYHTHHGVAVLDASSMSRALECIIPGPADTIAVDEDLAPQDEAIAAQRDGDDPSVLRERVRVLEERVRQLQAELGTARAQVAVEVDFSDLDAPVPSAMLEAPVALHRRLRHDPRDAETLHELVQAYAGQTDRQWSAAHALSYLGQANAFERDLYASYKPHGLIAPQRALDAVSWRRHLHHPEDEALTSDIFAGIVSAVLLAQGAALKGKGQLPSFTEDSRLDPRTSTVAAVRAFDWAAQTLGMTPPALYAAPQADLLAQHVPLVPPACVLGKQTLTGRLPLEMAFVAGYHLAFYRQDRFVRLLVPEIVDLEDLFLAALLIGNRKLPVNAAVRRRVEPIAGAIEPLLEPAEIDQLRGAYQRFVEQGGRTNLQRWANAADLTAARAGLLLTGDLEVAERMLRLIGVPAVDKVMDELLVFTVSDRHAKLREHLGIVIDGG